MLAYVLLNPCWLRTPPMSSRLVRLSASVCGARAVRSQRQRLRLPCKGGVRRHGAHDGSEGDQMEGFLRMDQFGMEPGPFHFFLELGTVH